MEEEEDTEEGEEDSEDGEEEEMCLPGMDGKEEVLKIADICMNLVLSNYIVNIFRYGKLYLYFIDSTSTGMSVIKSTSTVGESMDTLKLTLTHIGHLQYLIYTV